MKSLTRLPSLAGLALCLAAAGCEELPNVPPSAAFIYSPVAPIVVGQTSVLFNAAGSTDTDGSIRSYLWEFGDGSAQVTVAEPATRHVFTGSACVPSLSDTATYAVSLTVVDDAGARSSSSQNVTVDCP